jgi:glycosyltransferase involved in cell wall biosynthesis
VKLSVVIPTYNEEENIEETILELKSAIQDLSEIKDYEILVIDDHSDDNTPGVVSRIANCNLQCIRLSRRCGSHIALRAGIKMANGDFVLCISADGQDDPKALGKMVKLHQEGHHIIWALRNERNDEGWLSKQGAQFFYKLLGWLVDHQNKEIDLSRADFYLLDKIVVNSINSCPEINTSLFGLISWMGFKQSSVNYERRKRRSGKSKWSLQSRFNLAKDWIVAFSGLPLKLMAFLGLFIAFLGACFAVHVVFNYFLGNPVQGWSSLMMTILILGGTQMALLGVIGEYLWRNFDESRRRPLYFIEKHTK